jgi:WD40 repeat protein
LVFADQGGAIHIWDVQNRKEETVFEALGRNITHLVFNPDETILALASSGDESVGVVQIWDMQTGQEIARFNHNSVNLNFDLDSSELYSISSDRQLEIWDVKRGMKHSSIQLEGGVEEGFDQVIFSPDLSLIVAHTQDGIQIWNTANGEKIIILPETTEFSASRISFSRDGKLMAIVGNDYTNYEPGLGRELITGVQVWGIPIQNIVSRQSK